MLSSGLGRLRRQMESWNQRVISLAPVAWLPELSSAFLSSAEHPCSKWRRKTSFKLLWCMTAWGNLKRRKFWEDKAEYLSLRSSRDMPLLESFAPAPWLFFKSCTFLAFLARASSRWFPPERRSQELRELEMITYELSTMRIVRTEEKQRNLRVILEDGDRATSERMEG